MRISVRRETLNLAQNKVADRNGNPLMISGVVTYLIEDTRRAALDVFDCHSFIRTQATCVLKVVASKYPYEAPNHEPSLKTGSNVIKEEMRAELQRKVAITGAQIDSFELTDLSYAPEVISNCISSWTEFVFFRLHNRCL
jgi:regulator of protease activity HflC (stomatin/prohibitin superfamily)